VPLPGRVQIVTLGQLMRQHRLRVGISGAELSRRLGRSQPWVSRVERDVTRPVVDDVERLAKVLELDQEQTAELVQRARVPGPDLDAKNRRAVIQRIETLLDLVRDEVAKLR
jgi:transcriptional regulator with XRE-family HTH domain